MGKSFAVNVLSVGLSVLFYSTSYARCMSDARDCWLEVQENNRASCEASGGVYILGSSLHDAGACCNQPVERFGTCEQCSSVHCEQPPLRNCDPTTGICY